MACEYPALMSGINYYEIEKELSKRDYYTYYGTNNLVSILFSVYTNFLDFEANNFNDYSKNLFNEFRKILSDFNYDLDNQIIKLDVKEPSICSFYEIDKDGNQTGKHYNSCLLKFELYNLLSNIEFEYELSINMFFINNEPHLRIKAFEVYTRTSVRGTDEEYYQNPEDTKIKNYMKKMANIYNF